MENEKAYQEIGQRKTDKIGITFNVSDGKLERLLYMIPREVERHNSNLNQKLVDDIEVRFKYYEGQRQGQELIKDKKALYMDVYFDVIPSEPISIL